MKVTQYLMLSHRNCRIKHSLSSYQFYRKTVSKQMKDRSEIHKEAKCQHFQFELLGTSEIGNYEKHKH